MLAHTRQHTESHLPHSDMNHATPPPSFRGPEYQTLSVPSGLVLNDVPPFTDSSSLLRPSQGSNSPYPTIPSTNQSFASPRPRAHTFADANALQQQQQQQREQQLQNPDSHRRGTPVTPAGPMHTQYQLGQRHVSEAQAIQANRQQYIPPPPPPAMPTPAPQAMQLPPPPPRPHPNQTPNHGMMVPPPPGSSQAWPGYGRQAAYQMPPQSQPRAYDPTAYQAYSSLPPLPPD
ncbi:mitogen-activated protein kinase kinase kinase, partial [Elasticomyces elasticus]